MRIDISKVENSFEKISPRLDELTMFFYSSLFSEHPDLRDLFSNIDLIRQRRKLAAMLTLIVTNLRRMDVLIPTLRLLGEKHIKYEANIENYGWVENILLESIEKISGDNWDDKIASAWAAAIGFVTNEMITGAEKEYNKQSQPQDSDDMEILMEIASNPSLSFQRQSLFNSYIEKKKSDHEMNLARDIQQNLIPQDFPNADRYLFKASYQPASEVGGDYYDWIHIDNDNLCFFLGDVSGKGIPGALIMSRLSGAARAILTVSSDTTAVLTSINSQLSDRMPDGRFVTLACIKLNLLSNEYILENAGHLLPILRRTNGSSEFIGDKITGIPIGIDNNTSYKTQKGTLKPGESLVLYTDGISEAMTTNGNQYGMDRLLTCVADITDPATINNQLLNDVIDFAGGRPQNDDIAILTICRLS